MTPIAGPCVGCRKTATMKVPCRMGRLRMILPLCAHCVRTASLRVQPILDPVTRGRAETDIPDSAVRAVVHANSPIRAAAKRHGLGYETLRRHIHADYRREGDRWVARNDAIEVSA